jgi:hypothetical protein
MIPMVAAMVATVVAMVAAMIDMELLATAARRVGNFDVCVC